VKYLFESNKLSQKICSWAKSLPICRPSSRPIRASHQPQDRRRAAGSASAPRIPDRVLRPILAVVLALVGAKLMLSY
jgi:hypothetical protein